MISLDSRVLSLSDLIEKKTKETIATTRGDSVLKATYKGF